MSAPKANKRRLHEFPKYPDLIGMVWILLMGGLGACAYVDEANDPKGTSLEFECAVGDVTSHEAMVWLKTIDSQYVKIQYTTDPLWSTFLETFWVPTIPETDFTAHIPLTHLTSKTRYWYRSLVQGQHPGGACQFVTSPLPDDSAPVIFVIGGDTRHSFQPFLIMETMRQVRPDFFVFLGDTIYADKGFAARTLSDYWGKYVENRDGFARRFFAETSLYVMWDDHEVDSDFISTHPLMPIGRQAFLDYWPIRQQPQEPTRLYRSFRWGKAVELFFLDTRQYRHPIEKTMLGEDQKQWLLSQLGASSARFKFIISSVPFSDPRVDKWGEYPEERDEILRFITEQGVTGVLFLAGDVHHAGVSRMPGLNDRKECIFGPMAAPVNYKISSQEPRFEYFNDDAPNFGKITVQADGLNPLVQVEWFDAKHVLLHRVIFEDDRQSSLNSQ